MTGMDDPETIRQRGLDDAAETLHYLRQRQEEHEQRLHAPQGSAGEPEWTPAAPAPQPSIHREQSSHASSGRPPRPSDQPVRRAPAPPAPDRVQRPRHDASGRIVSVSVFEGRNAAAAADWESWTRAEIAARFKVLDDAMAALATEIGADVAKLQRRIASLEKVVEQLAGRDQPLAEAAD